MESYEEPAILDSDRLLVLTESVSLTARVLFSAGSVVDMLNSLVDLASTTIDGCDFAGLFLREPGTFIDTPVHTDPLVLVLEALQRRTGEGPCLEAISTRAIVYADHLDSDTRWPQFSSQATSAGVRSVLVLPLVPEVQEGALTLYAQYSAAFSVVDRAKAAILSSLASWALSVAHTHEDEIRNAENLTKALSSREIIGEALGILMERERISANQAFDILRRASQYLNIKLREVAQSLVETGEDPDTGPAGS